MNKHTNHSIGPVVLDKDARGVKPNEMTFAQDNEILGTEGGKDFSTYPLPSSLLSYEIPAITAQYQYVRYKFDPTATSYRITIKDTSGNPIGPPLITIIVGLLPSPTIANFVTELDTRLSAFGFSAVLGTSSGLYFTMAIVSGATTFTPLQYTITQTEVLGGVTSVLDVFTVQEAFNPISDSFGQFKTLQSIQVNNVKFDFSLSGDGEAKSIGYAVQDDNMAWTYTPLIVTRNLDFPENKVIEIQVEEVNNNQYAFYWVNDNGKPKTLYVPTDLSTPLKYTMNSFVDGTSGLFTLESLAEQTNLQIQNYGRITYSDQEQSGGSLDAGTWFYFVQSGINRNYSEWSPASEPIPVFTTTTKSNSAGAIIGGDKTPAVTGKINVLNIEGVDSKVYDTVRVAAMVNQGGAYSAIIVGEYDVVTSGNTFTIRHSGLEESIEPYDVGFLPPVQDVIINAKNIQIKKNRLNLANITKQVEEDLDAVFANVTLGQTTQEMDSVGEIEFSSENLFRAGLNAPYSNASVGQQSIALNNDSTNGNFDNGAYFNIGTGFFTVPTTGEYIIQIPSISFGGSIDDIGAREVYILNNTTGDKYCYMKHAATENFIRSRPSFTQRVTLTAGNTLVLAAVFERINGISSSYAVLNASFVATKVISNYPIKSIQVGEYQEPENVATKSGYMVNETYAYYGRLLYDSGYLSEWRYIGNYLFGGGQYPSSVANGNMTYINGSGDTKVYAYGLTISGINVTNIKNRVRRIEIGRAVCNPTVLGTGIFIASDSATGGAGGSFTAGLYTGNTNTAVDYGTVNNSSSNNRLFGMMLCPDWATGAIKPQFQEGDVLIVYGTPLPYSSQIIAGGSSKFGSYREFYGEFQPNTGSPVTIAIDDGAYCEWNTDSRVLRNDFNNLYYSASLSNNGSITTLASEGMALALEDKINQGSTMLSLADYGCYYVQYVRPNANQYSPIDATIVSCNTYIDIDESSNNILGSYTVFGGDTYSQKTYMKVMYNAFNPDTTKNGTLSSFIGFYSQNKINQQMRFVDKTFNNQPFPFGNSLDNYLFGTYEAGEQFQIDKGYSWENPTGNARSYNPRIPKQSTFKSRIIYTQQKPLNSLQDTYRIFLPNDFKDLDAKNGEINGLYDINDIMVALQPFKVNTLPYQSDVGLSAADGSVFIGSGGVYAQRENPISTYGADIKSGTLVAENEAGNTVLYWFSTSGRGLFRYGSDGVKNLSEENHWRTWFYNQTNLINSEYDVVMGFDRVRSAVFVTARAYNESVSAWNSGTSYVVGNIVRYAPVNNDYKNFEKLPDIYIATGNSTGLDPFNNPSVWQYIPITNSTYYNYWTAMYNEKYNFFQGFFSLLVSRYFYFNGNIFVPRGRAPFNKMYELFGGSQSTPLRWLDDGGVFKQGTFVIEWASNNGGIPCRYNWLGLVVGTDHHNNNPTLLAYNDSQTSQSVGGSDFTYLNGQIAQGILPDAIDDPMTSEFLKVRFSSTVYYRVYSAVVSFYLRARTLFK
jgi:hypothetical protein